MLDIKFVRDNPEAVKENIRKKFQDLKLPLVDEVLELDKEAYVNDGVDNQLNRAKEILRQEIGISE